MSIPYRGWTVYELPPNTQGIAALMMLNVMEQFPLTEYGFHTAKSLHVMIEAKKLAYADMLSKAHARERAALIDPQRAARHVEPSIFAGLTTAAGGDTIYLSVIDRDGN